MRKAAKISGDSRRMVDEPEMTDEELLEQLALDEAERQHDMEQDEGGR